MICTSRTQGVVGGDRHTAYHQCLILIWWYCWMNRPGPTLHDHVHETGSTDVTPRDRCARCFPVIRCCCLVIRLCVASFHVIMCIASSCFQNPHPSGFPQFRLLPVLSPTTLARACGTSEILFYKWQENVLGLG